MLRLRRCSLTDLLPSPSAVPISSLRRLLSAAAAAPQVSGFAVDDYLVDTCGLTRPQALKASTKLSHLKSPAKPDAVLAFLAGLGLPSADVAAVVAKDPRFLCASVGRTLSPNVAALTGLGLSRSQIVRLVPLTGQWFRNKSIVSKLQYYLYLFGSFDQLQKMLQRCYHLIGTQLGKVVKPNVAFLQDCGLSDCDIGKLCNSVPRLLTTNPASLRAMVVCAEGVGIPRGSGMFRSALQAVAFLSEEKIAAKMDYLKKLFGWSDLEVCIAVSRAPLVLRRSKDTLRRKSRFLISEVGLEPLYIAHRPIMICLSLEVRLRPRYYVVKFLKENGLLKFDRSYYYAVALTEKCFKDKYICPHKEAAPHLAEDYAAACRGEMPTRFRFT